MSRVLEVERLVRSFGGLKVAQAISLSLAPGDRVALIGPNGAGKTTFVDLVTGHLPPDSGSVRLDGEDITRLSPRRRVQRGLVRSFQVTRLFPDLSPREHLVLGILQRKGLAGRMFGTLWSNAEALEEAAALLTRLGLDDVADARISQIAYGQQRLLEVALALALKPKVLLLDEPASGVPQSETPRIDAALSDLPPELAVLMIDHDMDLVFRFAKRVIVLAAGAIIFDGPPAEAAADASVREAYLGSYADGRSGA